MAITSPTQGSEIIEALSADRLLDFATHVAAEVRLSGSPEEARSFDYIAGQLESFGLSPRRYQADTLISIPGEARLTVLGTEARELECITHSMAVSTPPDGLELEIGNEPGQVALIDGLASPGKVRAAEARGCFAQIYVNDDNLHEMIVSAPYGSPTPDSVAQLPRSVAVSITRQSGDVLKGLLSRGPVRVRLETTVDTRWRPIPLLTVDIDGPHSDGTFAFFGTHVDSWHYGATDNAAGNAIALEMARVLSQHRDELERGVRLLFWSGHSHGRYAGSCWYVDHFWQELYDHAVVGMSVDSPGGVGATGLGGAKVMDEALGVMRRAVDVVFPNAKARATRPEGGEQPLWRVGVPSLNPLRGRQEKGSPTSMIFSPSSGWWHHTRADTVDKIDKHVLRRDAQVHLLSVWTIVSEPVLPFDYAETARGVLAHLEALPSAPKVDLSDLVDLSHRLERAAAALGQATGEPRKLSDAIRRLGRALIPAIYTLDGPWEPDSTLNKGFVPGLADVRRLAEIDAESDEAYLLRTRLVRQKNRIAFALRSAAEIAERAL